MTKKSIWLKLLVVALIVATVAAFFIGCKKECTEHVDKNGDNKCDNCGADMPKKPDDGDEADPARVAAVNGLLAIVNDAIAELANAENVGNLGTSSYIDVTAQGTNVKVALDLSLDLLPDNGTNYENNGFGFTVDVDGKNYFGAWFVNGDENLYLSINGKNLKINALKLSEVLAKYEVYGNAEIGSELEGVDLVGIAGTFVPMIAKLLPISAEGLDTDNRTITIALKELFAPESLEMLADLGVDFGSLGLNIDENFYNSLPDVNVVLTGKYTSGSFNSIGLGVKLGATNIEIPVEGGDPIKVEIKDPIDVKAEIGFDMMKNEEALDLIAIPNYEWQEIGGAINVALEADLMFGYSKDAAVTEADATTYKLTVAGNIDPAAIAAVDLTKEVYVLDEAGNYVKNEKGEYVTKNVLYLSNSIPGDSEIKPDILTALLGNVNSLMISLQGKDSTDLILINVDEKIVFNEAGTATSGKVTINLAGVTKLLEMFGVQLDSTISNMINKISGTGKDITTILTAVKPVLSGLLYKNVTAKAPADAAATSAVVAEDLPMAEGDVDIMGLLTDIFNYAKACIKETTEDTIVISSEDANLPEIGGAKLTFNAKGQLIENGAKVSDLNVNLNYKDGEVVTNVKAPEINLGGANNIFNAKVIVDQTKKAGDNLHMFVGFNLLKVGYGCAPLTPIKVDTNGNVDPSTPIFGSNGFQTIVDVPSWWEAAQN